MNKVEVNSSKLSEIKELVDAMAMELHFRGCDEDHKLIRRSKELHLWIDGILGSPACK